MSGDNERRWRVTRQIRQGLIAWATMHIFVSAITLYSLYKPDPAGIRLGIYFLVGLAPIAGAMLYFEARATWLGKDDTEMGASIAALSIAGALGFLAWYLS